MGLTWIGKAGEAREDSGLGAEGRLMERGIQLGGGWRNGSVV